MDPRVTAFLASKEANTAANKSNESQPPRQAGFWALIIGGHWKEMCQTGGLLSLVGGNELYMYCVCHGVRGLEQMSIL